MICNQNNTVTILVNKIIQALQTTTKLTEICLNNFRHLNHMPAIPMYWKSFHVAHQRLRNTLTAAKKDKRALLMKLCKVNVGKQSSWQTPQLNDWHLLRVKKWYNEFCYVSWARLVKRESTNSGPFSIHSPK